MLESSERSTFLINMTLTELSFILFFILMLFAAYQFRQASDKALTNDVLLQEKTVQVSALEDSNEAMFNRLQLQEKVINQAGGLIGSQSAEDLDAFFTTLVKPSEQFKENQQLKDEVNNLKETLLKMQDELARNEATLNDAALKEASTAESQTTEPQTLDKLPEQLKAQLIRLNDRHRDLLGQVKNLQTKLFGLGGRDLPPCWANADSGEIEYLLDIDLLEQGISAMSAWPAYRQEQAIQLPGLSKLITKVFSLPQFSQLSEGVFAWSESRQCRHYVRVYDKTQSKKAFKTGLSAVENRFYKYLSNTGGRE